MIVSAGSKPVERQIEAAESKKSFEEDLVAQARRDRTAFAELYRRHYDAVFRYCVHRLFERQTAEDVTSAVFLKVVENFHRFKGTETDFRRWLYKIATNAVNHHLRKTSRRNYLLASVQEHIWNHPDDCETSADKADIKLQVLREAMLNLKPRYQTIITLRFFENLKLTEIAEVLGSSDGTVRSQLARALTKLRKKLTTDFTD